MATTLDETSLARALRGRLAGARPAIVDVLKVPGVAVLAGAVAYGAYRVLDD